MSSVERALKHQGGQRTVWTNEQIFEELKASAKRNGKLRSHLFLKDYYNGLTKLTLRTIHVRFGSWNNAARAAGFEPCASTAQYYDPFTKEDCLNAVLKVTELLDGELPSTDDYKNVRICHPEEGWPSTATVRGMFDGRWVEVLRAAEEVLQNNRKE